MRAYCNEPSRVAKREALAHSRAVAGGVPAGHVAMLCDINGDPVEELQSSPTTGRRTALEPLQCNTSRLWMIDTLCCAIDLVEQGVDFDAEPVESPSQKQLLEGWGHTDQLRCPDVSQKAPHRGPNFDALAAVDGRCRCVPPQ